MARANGWCVYHDVDTAIGLLRPAALLRARPDGGLGEGLIYRFRKRTNEGRKRRVRDTSEPLIDSVRER